MEGGVYTLVARVNRRSMIPIGRLGKLSFEPGYYLYTGSALRALDSRLKRHLRPAKKLRWHIDYLLTSGSARARVAVRAQTPMKLECALNQRLEEILPAKAKARGFGSSDCRSGCWSHLLFVGNQSLMEVLDGIRESYRSLNLEPWEYSETTSDEG